MQYLRIPLLGLLALMPLALGGSPAVASATAVACDYNGNGKDDLAIGAPGEGVGTVPEAGVVHVLYGSPSGLTDAGDQLWHQELPGVPGVAEDHDFFGDALSCGDYDGDGYDDLAIGADGEDVGTVDTTGVVHVLYGSPSGLTGAGSQLWYQGLSGVTGVAEAGDRFGWPLSSGDYNGDGKDDLAIGAPREDVGSIDKAGVVHVLYGSPSGLTAVGNQLWQQGLAGVAGRAETDDWFGYALSSGDYDGDGKEDLAVGAADEDVGALENAGVVHVLYGSPAGLTGVGSELWHQGLPVVLGTAEAYDYFGAWLSSGDYNGDDRDDLAIGADGEDVGAIQGAGVVHVLYGSPSGLTGDGDQLWHQGLPGVLGTAEDRDYFGGALSSGDYDGDGYDDLAIGASGEDVGAIENAGVVHVLRGSKSGLTDVGDQLWQQGSAGVAGGAETDDWFGYELSSGDYDNDDKDDLAIGAPWEDVGAFEDAGAVNVLYGSPSGLTDVGDQLWHQGLPGVLGLAEGWELFGSSLGKR